MSIVVTPDLLDSLGRCWVYLPGVDAYRHGAFDALTTVRRSREEIEDEAGPVVEVHADEAARAAR
jgi:hypothetical protein